MVRYPYLAGCEACGALYVNALACPGCGWESGMVGFDSDAKDHTLSSGSYAEYKELSRKPDVKP
jgi:hypothetical protein